MSKSVLLTVTGMKCAGCENNLSTKLSALNGIVQVKASHQNQSVAVDYDPSLTNQDEIEDTIIAAGYAVA